MSAIRNFLVVGGTSGLGEATAKALAGMNHSVTIAGRNESRGLAVKQQLDAINPNGRYDYKRIDLSRIKDTVRFAREFAADHATLDGLFITAGIMRLSGRVETEEGIDEELATHYYGRWSLINEMMPLLEKSVKDPLDVRVISVLGAKKGGWIANDDLELKTHYNFIRARLVAAAYNDLTMPEFSARHPTVQFNHVFPGVVNTPLSQGLPFPIPVLARLASFMMTAPEKAGKIIASTAFSDKLVNPWNLIDENGQAMKPSDWITKDLSSKVWEHTESLVIKAKN